MNTICAHMNAQTKFHVALKIGYSSRCSAKWHVFGSTGDTHALKEAVKFGL